MPHCHLHFPSKVVVRALGGRAAQRAHVMAVWTLLYMCPVRVLVLCGALYLPACTLAGGRQGSVRGVRVGTQGVAKTPAVWGHGQVRKRCLLSPPQHSI